MLASFCDGSEIGQRGALIEPVIVVEGKEESVGFSEEFSASPCVTIFWEFRLNIRSEDISRNMLFFNHRVSHLRQYKDFFQCAWDI